MFTTPSKSIFLIFFFFWICAKFLRLSYYKEKIPYDTMDSKIKFLHVIIGLNNLKLGQKIGRGTGREDMHSYLDERMWRQWRAENPQNAMDNVLAVLAGQYIVNNPVL